MKPLNFMILTTALLAFSSPLLAKDNKLADQDKADQKTHIECSKRQEKLISLMNRSSNYACTCKNKKLLCLQLSLFPIPDRTVPVPDTGESWPFP